MSTQKSNPAFIHLHNHLEGSYSDSVLRSAAALDRVVEFGMNAFAITDHGELAGVPTFCIEAEKRGITPIVGMEAYFVEDAGANIAKRINDRYHLSLIAADAQGWRNLVAIATRSWKDNCLMQKLGLVDWKLLEELNEGIICMSGCMAGPIAWPVIKNTPELAERMCGRLTDLFGDRFYIEVFDHGMDDERKAVVGLQAAAKRVGRPIVLTNDCHYLNQEDWILHDTVIRTRFGKANEFELSAHEYHLKSAQEMRRLDFPKEYSDVTLEIAERIELKAADIATGGGPREGNEQFAFLKRPKPLALKKAVEKAASALRLPADEQERIKSMAPEKVEAEYPEVATIAKGIEGIAQKPEPELELVVRGRALYSMIPMRRAENALFTMWNEDECARAGADILPVNECPLLHPISKATRAYFSGLEAHKRRRFDKARKYFVEALQHDPRFANAMYQLALSFFYAGDYDEAAERLKQLKRKEPGFERRPHLDSYLGWCLHHLGEESEALACFEESLAEKEIPGSLLGKGLTLEKLGRVKEAVEAITRMIELAPTDHKIESAHNALERLLGKSDD